MSKEIHETLCFFEDKGTNNPLVLGTSNSLGYNNLLDSENPEDKRIVSSENIVSKLFISKNSEDKLIFNYNLIV